MGNGRAFCAGGDVAGVIRDAVDETTRTKAIEFFRREFELDYILAIMRKPYVAILDGLTMGGGVGLAAHAPFRIATENTVFSMPETKIGYFPDVGASYFMGRLDGELGTYLALTADRLKGREVFEHGFATHFIPARRIPILLDRLAALEDPYRDIIDRTIEELSSERESEEPPPPFTGAKRAAVDYCFQHNSVEKIIEDLKSFSDANDATVSTWARETSASLQLRSPTSLKVALEAIRRGKTMSLLEALQMEMGIATAYCSGASPDFKTGVTAVLIDKTMERPNWSPDTLTKISDEEVLSKFFSEDSPYRSWTPKLTIPDHLSSAKETNPMRYTLPTEKEIGRMVRGSDRSSGGSGIKLEELVAKFEDVRRGKRGVREKVVEVAQRKCDVVDNSDGNFEWLKWKH
jgi:3-hydroxyisobutyryl-CoA hydrolase